MRAFRNSLTPTFFLLASAVIFANPVVGADRVDLLVADFEGPDYGSWQTTGEAFGGGPALGTLPGQMPVSGFEGKGLVNSYLRGDPTTGTLTSPEFTLERHFLSFLVGGGGHEGRTCMNLLVEGKTVRTANGNNVSGVGSERLEWASWDVKEWEGQKVQLQIVDAETGPWGHINIDQILQTDLGRGLIAVEREIELEHSYLHLPVKNGVPKRLVKFSINNQTVREFEIELAEKEPDFWVFADVRRHWKQKLTISARLPANSTALDRIAASDTAPDPDQIYHEALRPQFHFTSKRGWLNDPNGLVFSQGAWHLFYQHNPYGWSWGNMHWGHAASRDLFHWNELPTAIFPKTWGDFAFSGSAIVDQRNEAGLQRGALPVLIAFYTSTARGECLVYSSDHGVSWLEYDKNPVVKHTGRDPKVIWHEASRSWIMAVYDEPPNAERGIAFYTSKDLKTWTFTSRIGGFYECPDLFPMALDTQQKWVLHGADGKYLLGDFNGQSFQPEFDKPQQLWFGNFYAAQTYSDAPEGRRVQIGWANGINFPGMPFNQQMTVPVELSLRTTAAGPRLHAWPVRELEGLAEGSHSGSTTAQAVKRQLLLSDEKQPLDLFDLFVEFTPGDARQVAVHVQGVPVTYSPMKQTLTCRNVIAPLTPIDGKISLRILGDRNSLEIFANQGQVAISIGGSLSKTDRAARISVEGAEIVVDRFQLQTLKSAWEKQ